LCLIFFFFKFFNLGCKVLVTRPPNQTADPAEDRFSTPARKEEVIARQAGAAKGCSCRQLKRY